MEILKTKPDIQKFLQSLRSILYAFFQKRELTRVLKLRFVGELKKLLDIAVVKGASAVLWKSSKQSLISESSLPTFFQESTVKLF